MPNPGSETRRKKVWQTRDLLRRVARTVLEHKKANQVPVKFGLRFSTKAATPSR